MAQSGLQMASQSLNIATSEMQEMLGLQELITKEVQNHMALASNYATTAEKYLAEIQLQSGENSKHYQWYRSRYSEIKAEYDLAFGISMPRQEQGEEYDDR